jgi:protein translocase SecG subunit
MLATVKTLHIIISIVLIVLILIQSKSSGLSSSLKNSFSMYRSLRGFEKIIFYATIVSGSLLVINSLVILLLS